MWQAESEPTGTPQDQFLKVAEQMAATSAPDKVMTVLYALGWTQHSVGSQNIRCIAIIQGEDWMDASKDRLKGYRQALAAADSKRYHAEIAAAADWLLRAQNQHGMWGYDIATRERGLDDIAQVIAAGGKNQQRFGQRVHGVVQHHLAQLLGQRSAAGLAADGHGAALCAKGFGQPPDVRGFACAVDAFKGDEQTGS